MVISWNLDCCHFQAIQRCSGRYNCPCRCNCQNPFPSATPFAMGGPWISLMDLELQVSWIAAEKRWKNDWWPTVDFRWTKSGERQLMYIRIYIYIFLCTYIYIYIYIYRSLKLYIICVLYLKDRMIMIVLSIWPNGVGFVMGARYSGVGGYFWRDGGYPVGCWRGFMTASCTTGLQWVCLKWMEFQHGWFVRCNGRSGFPMFSCLMWPWWFSDISDWMLNSLRLI